MQKQHIVTRPTATSLLARLKEAMPEIQERYKVRSMALFGSCARGDCKPDSDVDIVVEVDPSIGLEFVSLAEVLQDLLGRQVDLVSRRAISPRHWAHISRDLLYV